MLLQGNPLQKCAVMAIISNEIIIHIAVSGNSFCFHYYCERPFCCSLLLKQVIDSHQFKPTDVFTGNHIYNTNATKNTEQF